MSTPTQAIRLHRLTLTHFKGIASLDLSFDGQSALILGANGTGKTTVVDAFHWLLFGKDSTNKKDFGIKTVAANGETQHNLTHEVEAALSVAGKPLTLKKSFAEKWTKKRGQALAEFSGHSTSHLVDGIPVSEKEYAATIAGVMGEEVFRLLTSPTYFNEGLHWQDRRRLLLQVVGDLTDANVIASNPMLAELPKLLAGRSLDDQRKVVDARRRQINQEMITIPVRIDEATRSLAEDSDSVVDVDALREMLAAQQTGRQELGDGTAVLRRQLRDVETRLAGRQNEIAVQHQKTIDELSRTARQDHAAVQGIEAKLEQTTQSLSWADQGIADLEEQMNTKRDAWRRVNAETFETAGEAVCAACGQTLPEDQIQAAYEKALAAFNRSKSERLETIQREGKALKMRHEVLVGKREALVVEQSQVTSARERRRAAWDASLAKAETAEKQSLSTEEDGQCRDLRTQQAALQEAIALPGLHDADALARIDTKIAALQGQIDAADKARLQKAQNAMTRQRIADLEAQEKTLATEFEALEHQLYLMDQFTRTKVNALESRINAKFSGVSFKLFHELVNGALEETAITLVNGVPFPDLNHAAKIQAGLAIINVLSAHYGVSAPVFVDGHESVSRLPAMATQVIRLKVSEGDLALSLQLDSLTTEKAAI